MSYPTLERMAACRRLATHHQSFGPPRNTARYWWPLMSPKGLKPVRRDARAEFYAWRERKRKEHSRRHRSIPVATVRRLRSEHPLCVYCGHPAYVIDHVLPVALGGTKFPHNLVSACGDCNLRKSDRLVEEFVGPARLVGPLRPRRRPRRLWGLPFPQVTASPYPYA